MHIDALWIQFELIGNGVACRLYGWLSFKWISVRMRMCELLDFALVAFLCDAFFSVPSCDSAAVAPALSVNLFSEMQLPFGVRILCVSNEKKKCNRTWMERVNRTATESKVIYSDDGESHSPAETYNFKPRFNLISGESEQKNWNVENLKRLKNFGALFAGHPVYCHILHCWFDTGRYRICRGIACDPLSPCVTGSDAQVHGKTIRPNNVTWTQRFELNFNIFHDYS